VVHENFKQKMKDDQCSDAGIRKLEKGKRNRNLSGEIDDQSAKRIKTMDDFGIIKTITPHETIAQKNEQEQLDDAVIEYITAEARPLNTIYRPPFCRLVDKRYGKAKLFGKDKLRSSIQDKFERMKKNLKEQLKLTNNVCLTCDAWSSRNRSYFGATVHWLNNGFKRESAAVACRRLKGIFISAYD
jgi:hypothetical protein